ncbi:MarR family winged helix-turn-helix transcriptional regulator [Limibacillus halophilus]|uniref:DNA-binding MarR family transcriptional regulator n=1 Tax=Limibacillus halophilus TaxID=1579333 RepID=A0A839T0X2_9PROT|nr:MarR family transcriptional regulator [Limibacillus halophilus]MBB3066793.1 DNA-binding MarR family transcriptional regulator [Limibacillus halophilus]
MTKEEVTVAVVEQECAVLRTRMAARKVTRTYDEALRPLGLKVTQFTLLVAIKHGIPDSISELAESLAMERTTLTRNLQLLEKQGLATIGPEGYRRARSMQLTPLGEEKLAAALPVWRQAQDQLVRKLGKGRWIEAKALLSEIISTA